MKILSQKSLFQSKYFSVIEKSIVINGQSFTKEFIKRNPAVFIAVLSPENEIYLASQYREALEKQSLELIAGNVDAEEDILLAAKRELSEEAGITANHWEHLTTLQLSANMEAKIVVFLVRDIEVGIPHQEEDEDIEIIKMSLQEAVKKVINGEINIASHAAIILLLDNFVKNGKI